MKKQSTHPEPPENYRGILDRRIKEIEDGTAELVSWEKVQAEIKLLIKTGKRPD